MAGFVLRMLKTVPGLLAQSALTEIDWRDRLFEMACASNVNMIAEHYADKTRVDPEK